MSSTDAARVDSRARHDARELRSFGLIVGGGFAGIALWPVVVRGMGPRWWALVLAVILILPALLVPRLLEPAHWLWMRLAEGLAWVNTRVLLSIVFFSIVTPMGLIMRSRGKDPMRRGFDPGVTTYRVPRQPRPARHMTRPF